MTKNNCNFSAQLPLLSPFYIYVYLLFFQIHWNEWKQESNMKIEIQIFLCDKNQSSMQDLRNKW